MIQRVEVPALSESLSEMQFLIGTIERATSSTASMKGVQTQGSATL